MIIPVKNATASASARIPTHQKRKHNKAEEFISQSAESAFLQPRWLLCPKHAPLPRLPLLNNGQEFSSRRQWTRLLLLLGGMLFCLAGPLFSGVKNEGNARKRYRVWGIIVSLFFFRLRGVIVGRRREVARCGSLFWTQNMLSWCLFGLGTRFSVKLDMCDGYNSRSSVWVGNFLFV